MPATSARSSSKRRRPRAARDRTYGALTNALEKPGKDAWFDAAAADRVCKFFEHCLTLTKAEFAGQPFRLSPWQRDLYIRPLFGWKRPDGTRWYSRADLWIPRKNGKTELVAGVCNYLLFADGELGAEIYLMANDKTQADIAFTAAKAMVEACEELKDRSQIYDSDRTKAVFYPETFSSLQAITSEPKNKDGLNPSAAVFDEIHESKNDALFGKMTTGSGTRRQPITMCISTAGADRHTIGWREYQADKRILAGKSKIDDRLVVIFEAGPDDDWRKEKTWRKANPEYGRGLKPQRFKSFFREALEDPVKEASFKRYHLNIWTSDATGWIPVEKWDECGGKVDLEKCAELDCWVGLDLSKRSDLTAGVCVFRDRTEPARYLLHAHFWVPGEGIELKEKRDGVPYREWASMGLLTLTPGDCVEYAMIQEHVAERWARRFKIREIPYDPYNANMLADSLGRAGLTMVEFPQQPRYVCPPTMELKNLVLEGRIAHGGNPILRWMVGNAQVIVDVNGNERLTKKASTARIDGLAATINALGRASVAESSVSVYQQRGVIAL